MLWTLTLILVAIGNIVAARRIYVLTLPSREARSFGPAAALDAGLAAHRRPCSWL
ncbi:MAG: hypothetical protein M3Y07_15190 [Acidobacteriota bacterium]|nr:hypothetical protein [Acidobacteriota bacterium]